LPHHVPSRNPSPGAVKALTHNGDPFTAEDVKLSFLRYRGASAKLQHDRAKAVDIVVAQKFSRTTRPLLGERDRMALHGAATELRRPRVRSIAGELEGAERARAPAARSAPDSPSTEGVG